MLVVGCRWLAGTRRQLPAELWLRGGLCNTVFSDFSGLNLVPADKRKKEEESQLSKATRDTNKVTIEVLHGLSRQVLKAALFNAAPPRQ